MALSLCCAGKQREEAILGLRKGETASDIPCRVNISGHVLEAQEYIWKVKFA